MIDLLTAHAIRGRVTQDGVIAPFTRHIVSPEGYSLESGLSWALKEVSIPRLIILPYILAGVLTAHEHTKFMEGDGTHLKRVVKESTWGYIGTYAGVDVVACAFASFAWVSSEANPSLLDGSNTVFLTLAEQ